MSLVEFYTSVLKSLNFIVEDDAVYLDEDKEFTLVGIPVVLPTRENIVTMLKEDGSPAKVIFNPLIEDVYSRKQGNKTLTAMVTLAKMNLSFSLASLSKLLMGAVDNKQTGFNTTAFVTLLNKTIANPAIKKLVDPKSIEVVFKILSDLVSTDIEPIRIIQVKNGKVGDEKFSVVTTIYSPLLDHIIKMESEGKIEDINGVTVRKKEVDTIKAIIKFMLSFEDENAIRLGSNSNQPGFMSLMSLYIAVATHFNDMAEELRKIDLEAYDNAKINLQLKFEDLEDIETLVTEAKLYPTESSTIGAIKEAVPVSTTPTRPVNPLLAKLNTVQNSKANNIPYTAVTTAESTMTEYQKAKMALNGGSAPVINEIPSLHNYRGPRPDLHVANIYNAAQPYNPYLNTTPEQPVQVQYDQYGRPIVPQVQQGYNPHLNNIPQEVNHYNGSNTTSRVHVSFSERLQQEQAQKNPYLNRY